MIRELALCALLVAACREVDRAPRWSAAGGDGPRRGGALRFSTTASLRTLDPVLAYDEVSLYATQHLFDTLIGYPPARPGTAGGRGALELVPQLAESWQVSEDGLELRFTLREGVRYDDGTAIVAADFKYALERALRTADSPFGGFLAGVVGAEDVRAGRRADCAGVRAPDDRHLEISLSRRDASFLYVLALKFAAPLPRAHAERAGAELRRRPLASGPYRLAAWREGERLTLERNPHHWDRQRGWIDVLTLLENVPQDVEFLMFERGELDVCYQPSSPDYLWLRAQPAWTPLIRRVDLMNVFGERINVTRPPFSDVRVRRALNYAVNKDHLVRLLHGTATPSHGVLPPGMFGRDPTLAPYPHDPARARALLAEAGYPHGFEVEYVTLAGDEPRRLAGSLQADLAEVGVRLKVRALSFTAYQDAVGAPDGPALSYTSWLQDYPDPSSFIDTRFHSRMIADHGSMNDSFYRRPDVDALIDEARAELDPAKRAAQYRALERRLYDDAPWIWEYHRVAIEVVQPYVQSYAPHPVWLRDYTSTWLDLRPDGSRAPRRAREPAR
ncbi:MAG: ABC transporter substrate-binding protein [Kofleriaceae bacterium]